MARKAREYVETNEVVAASAETLEAGHAVTLANEAELEHIKEALTEDQIAFSERIGMLKKGIFDQKLVTVTNLKLLAELKESKQYKGLRLVDADGKPVTVTTWEDCCLALDISREHTDEQIRNLSALGEDFLLTAERLGIGYRQIRKLRRLPADVREEVVQGKLVDLTDREEIVALIDDLAAKHATEKAAKDKEIDGLKADREADARLLATRTDKLNELERRLAKIETGSMPLAERIEPVMDEIAEFSKRLDLDMRNLAVIFAAVEEIAGAEADKPQDEADVHGVLPLVQRLRDAIDRAASAGARLQFEFEGRLQHHIGAAEMFLANETGLED